MKSAITIALFALCFSALDAARIKKSSKQAIQDAQETDSAEDLTDAKDNNEDEQTVESALAVIKSFAKADLNDGDSQQNQSCLDCLNEEKDDCFNAYAEEPDWFESNEKTVAAFKCLHDKCSGKCPDSDFYTIKSLKGLADMKVLVADGTMPANACGKCQVACIPNSVQNIMQGDFNADKEATLTAWRSCAAKCFVPEKCNDEVRKGFPKAMVENFWFY